MSYILILSLAFATPDPFLRAALDEETPNPTLLTEENAVQYWNVLANFSTPPPTLYEELAQYPLAIRTARAQALSISSPPPEQIVRIYQEEDDPSVQAYLLRAIGKHGTCEQLSFLENALDFLDSAPNW